MVHITRRTMFGGLGGIMMAGLAAPLHAPLHAGSAYTAPRMRVICDNDFAGDPDGLYQLAHHVRSPSVAIPMIIGSHLHEGEAWFPGEGQARASAERAAALLDHMGLSGRYPVIAGAERAMTGHADDTQSPAADAIIAEAMRDDTDLPLYYAAGAGLTDLALAWIRDPRIGRRMTVIWIGGNEHPDLAAPPPNADAMEYNLTIDRIAAQLIFNESDFNIWQIPRDAYRQMLVSFAELEEWATASPLGGYLKGQVDDVLTMIGRAPPELHMNVGETYVLGDSPLVTLTALQSSFQPDPSSSHYVQKPTPFLRDDGGYDPRPDARPMRVYTQLDTRMTFADLSRKMRMPLIGPAAR